MDDDELPADIKRVVDGFVAERGIHRGALLPHMTDADLGRLTAELDRRLDRVLRAEGSELERADQRAEAYEYFMTTVAMADLRRSSK
jgi:hypothetical protein